jgi:ketosteroid isomerase-like protein
MTTPLRSRASTLTLASALILAPALALASSLLTGCAPAGGGSDTAALTRQVFDTERAFAATMASRDHAAFTSFISDEAVFFSGQKPLRGRAQVAAWWKRYFDSTDAPFSWEPEKVEVLDSGTLALSTGPVHGPDGKIIGTFTSIWRQEEPGRWRIVFDRGNPACD